MISKAGNLVGSGLITTFYHKLLKKSPKSRTAYVTILITYPIGTEFIAQKPTNQHEKQMEHKTQLNIFLQ